MELVDAFPHLFCQFVVTNLNSIMNPLLLWIGGSWFITVLLTIVQYIDVRTMDAGVGCEYGRRYRALCVLNEEQENLRRSVVVYSN